MHFILSVTLLMSVLLILELLHRSTCYADSVVIFFSTMNTWHFSCNSQS